MSSIRHSQRQTCLFTIICLLIAGISLTSNPTPAFAADYGFLDSLKLPWRCGEKEPRRLSQDWEGHTAVGWALDFGHTNGGEYVRGTDILAPMGGAVTKGTDQGTGYGNWVKIDAGNGWTVLFAHLAAPSSAGSSVGTGDVVGHLGNSGTQTPHIHVEIRLNNGMPDVNQITRVFGHPRDDFRYAPNKTFYSNNCGTGGSSTSLQVEVGIYDVTDKYSGVPDPNSPFNPKHLQRDLAVQILNSSNVLVYSNLHAVQYNSAKKAFTGSVNLGNFQSGPYIVKLKLNNSLRKQVSGIVTIVQGANTLPRTSLSSGDVNGDNTRNILDYNLLMGCYSDLAPAPHCPAATKPLADLNDDGKVNQFDYNIIIRAFANSPGD